MCFLKIDVMGVLFDNVTMEQALDRAETLMEAKASAYCCLLYTSDAADE